VEADPKLGPLADNGGPSWTHYPLTDSPVIDTAPCVEPLDQRHVTRPQGATCDIGAVEFDDFLTLVLTLNGSSTVDPKTGVAVVTGTLQCSSPTVIPLEVELRQEQKAKRAPTLVTATATTTVSCGGGTSFWSASMVAPAGGFQTGNGNVTARSVNTIPSVLPVSAAAVVKLYWGKK
jgi:hypothetical protein